jgi:hypothetical protein
VGPISWDIDKADWQFWQRGLTSEECANDYLQEIIRVGRGIVLMHDSTADYDQIKNNNLTYETIMILIPQLKALGFKFVNLDKIPGISPYLN